ncbi:MAG: hypothetical protein J6S67_13900 [Methanobrevibacter sp.]|nr:hypothetical protein [Methanobrevibacter sp.]
MTKDELKNRISMALKDPILQQGFEIICKNLADLEKEYHLLGERCNQLLKDKGDLTDRVSNQAESLRVIMLEEEKKRKRIEELEQQIEKMKCCANCKHSRTDYEHCRTDKHEKWELRR